MDAGGFCPTRDVAYVTPHKVREKGPPQLWIQQKSTADHRQSKQREWSMQKPTAYLGVIRDECLVLQPDRLYY